MTANRYVLVGNGGFCMVPSDVELYHHGVKGMKWGVRRTPQQLGHKVKKLSNRNKKLQKKIDNYDDKALEYERKSIANRKHQEKYQARLSKATAKKAKYDVKLAKQTSKRRPNAEKIGKYTLKSRKYELEMNKAARKIKYDKNLLKSEDFKNRADRARSVVAKNKRLSKMYSATSKELEAGSIQQGRLFMRYVLEDD